jgi:hypothetical protein
MYSESKERLSNFPSFLYKLGKTIYKLRGLPLTPSCSMKNSEDKLNVRAPKVYLLVFFFAEIGQKERILARGTALEMS